MTLEVSRRRAVSHFPAFPLLDCKSDFSFNSQFEFDEEISHTGYSQSADFTVCAASNGFEGAEFRPIVRAVPGSSAAQGVNFMRRKACALLAGWLVAASIALAQTSAQSGKPIAGKRPLSPYYPTASTVDWSGGEASEVVPEMPPIPAAMPSRGTVTMQPTPVSPPVTTPPIQSKTVVPAAPGAGVQPQQTQLPMPSASVSSDPSMSLGTCPTCNTCCSPCGPNGPCRPMGRTWGTAEILLWWTKAMNVPPLVTSSSSGTPQPLAGVLGVPTTRILYGNDDYPSDMRVGYRLYSGMWLDDCNTIGLDGAMFWMNNRVDSNTVTCMDSMILARPFYDVNPGVVNPLNAGANGFAAPNSQLVCYPNVVSGAVSVVTDQEFWGFDNNIVYNLGCACNYRIDAILGYRYLYLNDKLGVTEYLVTTGNLPSTPAGTTFIVHDQFESTNTFNGGQIGLAGEVRRGRFSLIGRSTVALGSTWSEVTISGSTRVQAPTGQAAHYAGGLLAQSTNIGTYSNSRFAVVPEVQVGIGYQITKLIRAFVSYDFLYWSNVARAGDQVDLVVNSSQIPPGTLVGTPRPIFTRVDTDFWAQGISFGLELRY